jgi:hypothetical protein
MQRQAKLKLSFASALSLALPCAGCLVTNELDFEANLNAPSVRLIAPPSPSIVPCAASDECLQLNRPDSLAFRAAFYDRDVDQTLYAAAYINGVSLAFPVEVRPSPEQTPEHLSPVICIPRSSLRERCNRVRLIVTDNLPAQSRPVDELLNDPDVDYIDWYLSPPACDTESGAGKPDTSLLDCLPPDGGL